MTAIHKDKDGNYEPSTWQPRWHPPPFMLPSPDQKDLGLLTAQCTQSRLRVAQVVAGRTGYNDTYTRKKRTEEGTQTPYQLMPARFKLKRNLEIFMKLNRKGLLLLFRKRPKINIFYLKRF